MVQHLQDIEDSKFVQGVPEKMVRQPAATMELMHHFFWDTLYQYCVTIIDVFDQVQGWVVGVGDTGWAGQPCRNSGEVIQA